MYIPCQPDEDGTDCIEENRKVIYPAVYLPSYWDPADGTKDEEEYYNYQEEARACGNDTRMLEVNEFLNNFRKLLEVYQEGRLPEGVFRASVNALLEQVPE
ncbi:MAG: hypothetical protein U0L49_09715 [Eubacterium sp.]|nr:hypothetical protein [Eubacterium sp.]